MHFASNRFSSLSSILHRPPIQFVGALLLGTCLAAAGLLPHTANAQNTYTVDSNGDAPDANTGDGTCATSGGNCTLRAAIQEANATTNNDDIEFSIPTTGNFATISPSEQFDITEPVTIDGTTSPEYPSNVDGPAIVLDGSSLSSSADDGIEVHASDVTIQGLGINSFPDEGIDVFPSATGVRIEDCFIGIAVDDGETDRGNLTSPDGSWDSGIALRGDDFSLISNVISHNGGDGVYVDANGSGTTGLGNNIIGLDWNGDAAAGNDGAGVRLAGGSNVNVGIFALIDVARNYISANGASGIIVESSNHTILGNRIGTDSTGATSTGTSGTGLGNAGSGVLVLDDSTDINGNLISGNDRNGITVGDNNTSADRTEIINNTIGLNDAQDAALPNGTDSATSGGLVCGQSSSVGSGNTTTVDGNTISGNAGQGIWITETCLDWDILDNYVGTNSDFATGLGNNFDGVQVKSNPASNSEEVEVAENIIGNNTNDGVDIRGSYHDVVNNYIGVTRDSTAIGNSGRGIVVNGGGTSLQNVYIGGAEIIPGDGEAAGNPTPNGSGNVVGYNGDPLQIGNVGILVQGEASDFVIAENYVGTNPDGADFGNVSEGIRIEGSGSSSTDHRIGYEPGASISSPDPVDGGDGNVIAYNGTQGIVVGTDASTTDVSNTSVRGNFVYQNGDADNTDIGIDLGDDGVTSNDNADDDADAGPNNLQSFPIIENVVYDEANDEVSITYRVQTSTGNAAYPLKIDFYAADSEASGEGQTYLGTQEYSSGDARSSVTNVVDLSQFSDVTSDDHFVATATDANGNTSEFVSTTQQLPVELANFEAQQSGTGTVRLTWETASEQNNAGFRVQRRVASAPGARRDGKRGGSWTKVGFVDSKAEGGSSTEALTYRFTAEELGVGTHQFRLQQVDLNGTPHAHDPVTVKVQMQEALRLTPPAPNPVRGDASVRFAVREAKETTLQLFNTLGQQVATVYRGTPPAGEQQTVRLDSRQLSGLASGVYFLRLQAGEQTTTQRVTVVR